jgi:ketosteroid isomerase-like protein
MNLIEIAKGYYRAYERYDRSFMEEHLAADFTFTSPFDDHIDRAAYFERCWPKAGSFKYFDIKTIVVDGNECCVVYEAESRAGQRIRNTELLGIADGRVHSVEVFFGRPSA